MARNILGSAEHSYKRLRAEVGRVVPVISGSSGARELSRGDGIANYWPKAASEGETLQSFTTIGKVTGEDICKRDLHGDARLWMRDMEWETEVAALPIRPYLGRSNLIRKPRNREVCFRSAPREITVVDHVLIAGTMLGRAT